MTLRFINIRKCPQEPLEALAGTFIAIYRSKRIISYAEADDNRL